MSLSININATELRDSDRQVVFFTVTNGTQSFEFSHGSVPASLKTNASIKTWLIEHKDTIWLSVLKKLYPGADYKRFVDDKTDKLAAFQKWIAQGHKNKIMVDDEVTYEVIPKSDFKSNHPRWVKFLAQIDAAFTAEQAAVLKKIVRRLR